MPWWLPLAIYAGSAVVVGVLQALENQTIHSDYQTDPILIAVFHPLVVGVGLTLLIWDAMRGMARRLKRIFA